MKKIALPYPLALAFLCILLVAGCAKKPVPAPLTTGSAPSAENAVSAGSASGVQESGVKEAQVGEQAAVKEKTPVAGLELIHFDFDQFTLSSEARDALAANANVLKGNQGLRVRIAGYCDNRGSDEYNLALGERRAKAARDYMVSLGVAPDRLETVSYGEEMPLDPASTPAAWAKNRRDEFKVLN